MQTMPLDLDRLTDRYVMFDVEYCFCLKKIHFVYSFSNNGGLNRQRDFITNRLVRLYLQINYTEKGFIFIKLMNSTNSYVKFWIILKFKFFFKCLYRNLLRSDSAQLKGHWSPRTGCGTAQQVDNRFPNRWFDRAGRSDLRSLDFTPTDWYFRTMLKTLQLQCHNF